MADREKVVKALEYCVLSDDCRPCEYWMEFDDTGCQIMKDALALLKEQEAKEQLSDAVHETAKQFRQTIVRCKDCKHRPIKPNDYENGFDLEFPDNKCPCQNGADGWYSWYPDDNWFCADGERKEGDG